MLHQSSTEEVPVPQSRKNRFSILGLSFRDGKSVLIAVSGLKGGWEGEELILHEVLSNYPNAKFVLSVLLL